MAGHTIDVEAEGRVVFFPVRHHSPMAARMVVEMAERMRPDAVLIEGPADFNDRIDELFLDHHLPIAIYSYVRLADGSRLGAYYPFCVYSPEWQALLRRPQLGATVRFIDLPWAEMAADDGVEHRYADAELRGGAYVAKLCRRLGVDDFDALWDEMFEVETGDDRGRIPPPRTCLLRAPSPARRHRTAGRPAARGVHGVARSAARWTSIPAACWSSRAGSTARPCSIGCATWMPWIERCPRRPTDPRCRRPRTAASR